MRRRSLVSALGALLLVSSACATGTRGTDVSDVRRLVADRGVESARWDRDGASDAAVADAVRTLLSSDVGVDHAVEIALLRNHALHATFEQIGIAQADLVQSGLLRNPLFHLGSQLDTTSSSNVRLDYSVVFAFIDLLRIPIRKRVAAIDLERATLVAADAVLVLARDVRVAYWTLAARVQSLEAQRTAIDALEAGAELAKRQHEAGNLSDLDRMAEDDALLRAKIDRTRAEAQAVADREALNRLMGLCGAETGWRIAARMPDLPAAESALGDLERRALCQRLDLAAARQEARSVAAGLPLNAIDPWAASEFGLSGEKEVGGAHHLGPDLTLELPIFDTGRASAEKTRARFRQAEERYRALEVDVESQVREARARLLSAREVAVFHRDSWLPRRRKATQLWQEQYNAMLEGTYRLLEAKRAEIDAGRDWIDSLRDYWIARAELERAVGGRLPAPSATAPTSRERIDPPTIDPKAASRGEHRHGG